MPELFYGKDRWAEQRVTRSSDTLYVGEAEVMQSWETPLMHFMSDQACGLFRARQDADPRVLEVGWGMGISGRRLIAQAREYTVIEPHRRDAADGRLCRAGHVDR